MTSTKGTYCRGSSMVEVLVALFVLATGLLGVLALQTTSVRANQNAEDLSAATVLASEMVQMIDAYDAFANRASLAYTAIETDSSLATVDCSAGCTRANQVKHDLAHWSQHVTALLPGGIGLVNFDNATEMFTVTIMWDSARIGATGRNCSGDETVDLACYRVQVQF